MRRTRVYYNGIFAGVLTETDNRTYVFRYDDEYFNDPASKSISLTLNKNKQEYKSDYLFPFFFNMLSEGSMRQVQSRLLKIDPKDHFGILLQTAQWDTVGAITIKPY